MGEGAAGATMQVIGVLGQATGAIIGAAKAKEAKHEAIRQKEAKERQLANLEANRQELINPNENLTNEFANLGVATQAAEMQAEEADISLANTLDAMRTSGFGGGGATALAQMALDSKKGISASIESQESNNEKLRAEGATAVQRAKAEGEKFKWQAGEQREVDKLSRVAGELDQAKAQEAEFSRAQAGMTQQAIGGLSQAVGTTGSLLSQQ